MKIAYLTGEYPRATDTFIQREVAGLRKLGQEVFTASIRRTGLEHLVGDEQRREQAATFHVLETARNPLNLIKAHLRQLRRSPARYLRALRLAFSTAQAGFKGLLFNLFYFGEAAVLAEKMREWRVDHLHNHIAKSSCTVAMLASELSGTPYSFTLHGPDIFFEPKRWCLDEKIAKARFVSCISHFCRSQAMLFSDPSHWQKLHIVHCGVEPERYASMPKAPHEGNLLFVGRLAAVKGLPVLFDAMRGLGDIGVTLQVVGDGPDRKALETLSQEYDLTDRVTFLGYRSQSEVSELLANADALVLPSFAEGVPVVLMEAMAAARPVIATQVAGVSELVKDSISGLLCQPGDAQALTSAIRHLVQDAKAADRMGQAGRAAVMSEYDADIEAARLATLLAGYCNNRIPALRPAPTGSTS
ncbi:colanic acid biosynthesis glycosyltransferase WcaL [Rhodobacteraceae bacterium 63075]|nr:colanic acid biosynthesis glycosyltransferase WcaL [Rhodobacteraceae bacterium 63075]